MLADNGGPTQTQALSPESPAVDAGSCTDASGNPVTIDQRGIPRPQHGVCDIGAYELVFAGPPTATISSPADNLTFSPNQVVATTFSCSEAAGGPGLQSCVDSDGATGGAGGLNTSNVGVFAYIVTAMSKDGQTGTATFHYTVAVPPTASIGSPANNQTYALNQVVSTTFSCSEGTGGSGIRSCVDSNGSTRGAGTLITSSAGPRIYAVTATSNDGETGSATIHYVVTGPPSPPLVSGGSATTLTINGASVLGAVNPEGLATQAFFEYGLDLRERGPGASSVLYDQSTPVQQVGSDSSNHTLAASLTALLPGSLYHVRLVATSAAGMTLGQDQTFTTAAAPPPRAPVLGKSEDIWPVSGTVFMRTRTGQFIPLTGATQVPDGSVIDALHGSLRISASIGKGKTETGIFGGAIFTLAEAHSGLTTLSLVENAFAGAPSYAVCTADGASHTATAASSRTLQLLHASAHGRFRASGRYAAATIRVSKWTIADRCDGTLTHDLTDSVAVTDFVRHKTIILHAGQSYLAKARRRK